MTVNRWGRLHSSSWPGRASPSRFPCTLSFKCSTAFATGWKKDQTELIKQNGFCIHIERRIYADTFNLMCAKPDNTDKNKFQIGWPGYRLLLEPRTKVLYEKRRTVTGRLFERGGISRSSGWRFARHLGAEISILFYIFRFVSPVSNAMRQAAWPMAFNRKSSAGRISYSNLGY